MLGRVLAEVLVLCIRLAMAWVVMHEYATVVTSKLEEVARALGGM